MQTFDTIATAQGAIYDYPFADLPEDLIDKFKELRNSPSPVDKIVKLGEFLYAHRADDDMPKATTELAGGLVAFATINAWHGLLEDSRGDRIVQAVRRDLGDTPPSGGSWPSENDDPLPLREFLPPETPPAPPAS